FLHFAGVFGAADENDLLFEVDDDEYIRICAVAFRFSLKLAGVDYSELGLMSRQLFVCGTQEQLLRKERMPSKLADKTYRQLFFRIGAGYSVEHIEIAFLKIGNHAVVELIESLGLHRLIDFAPPDLIFNIRSLDDKFIVGRPTRASAGFDYKR